MLKKQKPQNEENHLSEHEKYLSGPVSNQISHHSKLSEVAIKLVEGDRENNHASEENCQCL